MLGCTLSITLPRRITAYIKQPVLFSSVNWTGEVAQRRNQSTTAPFEFQPPSIDIKFSSETTIRRISSKRQLSSATVFSSWNQDAFLVDATVKEKEEWLESMLKSESNNIKLDAFSLVFDALATTPDAGAPLRAERWLRRLKDHSTLQPTSSIYRAVIQSWANSHKEQPVVIVNRAERLLNELLALWEEDPGMECLKPTIELYNAYLDACTRGRSGRNKKNQLTIRTNAQKADALLRRLHSEAHHLREAAIVIPNTDSFNYVLRGWTRCKDDELVPKKVLSLLRLMESYQRSDPSNAVVRPNSKSYALVMDALISMAKLKARCCIQEGGYSSNTRRNGIAEMLEAEQILRYMHDLHDAGVKDVVPHRVPYNILLTGWASLAAMKHFDAPFKAEGILRKMFTHKDNGFVEASPDRKSFEKVMTAWAFSGSPNAGKRAQFWLKKLWNDSESLGDKDLLPTTMTYNLVINALDKSEGALAAENALQDLGEKYRESPNPSLCPNSESFSIVIHAWLKQANYTKDMDERMRSLQRAVEWLTTLREAENETNLSTSPELFTAVLKVAKRCARERPDAFELAKTTFSAFHESRHYVDAYSYSLLLEVGLAALSNSGADEERRDFLEQLLYDCCEEGLLGKQFIRALVNSRCRKSGWTWEEREENLVHLYKKLPFPPSWTRNLRSKRYMASKRDFPTRIHSLVSDLHDERDNDLTDSDEWTAQSTGCPAVNM